MLFSSDTSCWCNSRVFGANCGLMRVSLQKTAAVSSLRTTHVHSLALSDLVDNRTVAIPMSQVETIILWGPGGRPAERRT